VTTSVSETLTAEEVLPGIWRLVLPLPAHFLKSVNAYLIRDDDGFVLVDTGQDIPDVRGATAAYLDQLRISLGAIHTIVVTHGHSDHHGQANSLRARTGAKVWLHERDTAFIRYRLGDYQASTTAWLLRFGFSQEEVDEPIKAADDARSRNRPLEPDRLLVGGEELTVGPYRFTVVWTPGHTPGHVCLYEPDRHVLLLGDHVLEQVAPNVGLQPNVAENLLPGYLASLRELAEWQIDLGMPGHGAPFSHIGDRLRDLLHHQMTRRERLLALLGPEPRTAHSLAAEMWAHSTPTAWSKFGGFLKRNAVATLAAHLDMLVSEELVDRHEDEVIRYSRPNPV
jgi:glyoxylase-like metal-dependent hydrolase (beta-lactamase superfamily II)